MEMIDPKIDNKLKGFMATLPSEEIFFEAIRELMKDVIKEFLKKRINSDPELKDMIVDSLKEFIEAKMKEYDSMAKMAKITARIGISAAPEVLKEEALSDVMSTFQKEIEEIIRKTL